MLDTNQQQTLHLKSFRNLVIGEMFGSLGVIFEERLAFTTAKFLGVRSANELIHFLSTLEF